MQAKITRIANIVLITTLSVAALYFAAPLLIPIVLAALLAMLLVTVSNRLEKIGISRALASLIPILLFIFTIALLGLILSWQINRLAEDFSETRAVITARIDTIREWISNTFGIDLDVQKKMLQEQEKEASTWAGSLFFGFINAVSSLAINAVLVIIYTYLLIFYRSHLKTFILNIVPKDKKRHADTIIHKSVTISGRYLIGLFNMVAVLWVMYSIGFTLVGLEGAIFFAIICGILEIVPFFGNFVGNLIAIFSVLAQGGDGRMVLGIVFVYLTVQFLQTYILEPLVVGQQVNINPLFTIMALVAGELLWGIAGMALAIPVIGIVKIICDHIPALQPWGVLIGPAKAKRDKTSLLRFLGKRHRSR